MKTILFLITVLFLVTACADQQPRAESDSQQSFNTRGESDGRIPVDDNVYVITGKVTGPVSSLERQVGGGYRTSSTTDVNGVPITTYYYVPPIINGKGFVRLFVHNASPQTDMAQPERIAILKTTDTKVTALFEGDIATFKCRAQYESVAAVRNNETFDPDKLQTWELDYCRLVSPVISIEQGR